VDAETKRVLLIDDNEGFSYFVQDRLSRAKDPFETELAGDLAAGVAALDARRFEVVLLDLGLPDSGGFQTFERARAHAQGTPIIILTCLDDEDLALRAVRGGAQDYLLKDRIDEYLLLRSVRHAIERARIERELRELSGRIIRLQDDERRRLALSLHDTTAQSLAALTMNLETLRGQAGGGTEPFNDTLNDSVDCARRCLKELRTLSYLLYPPLLDELGLAGAVRQYADGFAERSGIRVDLDLPDSVPDLSPEAAASLFRVMQQALANIHRHAGSATASIALVLRHNDTIALTVEDRGVGIAPERLAESADIGVGILGMRERMRQFGGRLSIENTGHGTRVTAEMRVPAGEEPPR